MTQKYVTYKQALNTVGAGYINLLDKNGYIRSLDLSRYTGATRMSDIVAALVALGTRNVTEASIINCLKAYGFRVTSVYGVKYVHGITLAV